jgi:hypothetical protein
MGEWWYSTSDGTRIELHSRFRTLAELVNTRLASDSEMRSD